jgi:glycosyltransferase involved in cell wall biosynthesis
MPNCYFPGRFPFSEMPALLKGLQVCLLPYRAGEAAFYRSPLKLYEYLAAGRPVVAGEHPEALELAPWVYTAGTRESFLSKIETALGEDCPERRQQRAAMAQGHSWDRRVEQMEASIIQRLGI